ncbi:MAG: recombinase [Clostridia bacterium]|nr:recombinase [Clostridia bacterium]
MERFHHSTPATAGSKTAAYLRLSQEDGDKQESDSIRSQRSLIQEYAAVHSLHIVGEYVDDGYSGTNFDRPNFQRMMEDVRRGTVNCIIVKDLSRFGRNYIETGKYIERFLPSMGIRLIAINDNYDSATSDYTSNSMIIPFKNVINDAYSRDTSVKIRSQLDVKRRQGDFIGSFAAYGYQKDEQNRNQLVVDDYAAHVVQEIFKWKMDGMSCMEIADRLNAIGVLAPLEYKRMLGMNYNSGFKAKEKAKWSAVQVRRILTNELYIGNLVQGRHRKVNYKVEKILAVPENEWIRVENTHDPLIEVDTFERVQELLKLDTRAAENKGSNIFSGLVQCADCGQNMIRRMSRVGNNKRYYLHCSTYKNKLGCSAHLVSEVKLTAVVLESIQKQIEKKAVLEKVLDAIRQDPLLERKKLAESEHLAMLEREIGRYRMLRMQLYEDRNAGIISEEDYLEFSGSFTRKLDEAIVRKKQAEERMKAFCEEKELECLTVFKKYKGVKELDRRMLVELIDFIEIQDKKHFTIHFRFEDEMAALEQFCEAYCKGSD